MSKKRKNEKTTGEYLLLPAPASGGCLMLVLTLGLWPFLMRGRKR